MTFRQNKEFSKLGIAIVSAVFVLGAAWSLIVHSQKEWDLETIIFQMTMPGLDEEIAFRGIMLGLLSQTLKKEIRVFNTSLGTPSILITSILFGLVHSLFLSKSYEIQFHLASFCTSFVYGLIWAWLTVKSGSIILALISHNLSNTTLNLIRMLK